MQISNFASVLFLHLCEGFNFVSLLNYLSIIIDKFNFREARETHEFANFYTSRKYLALQYLSIACCHLHHMGHYSCRHCILLSRAQCCRCKCDNWWDTLAKQKSEHWSNTKFLASTSKK